MFWVASYNMICVNRIAFKMQTVYSKYLNRN